MAKKITKKQAKQIVMDTGKGIIKELCEDGSFSIAEMLFITETLGMYKSYMIRAIDNYKE